MNALKLAYRALMVLLLIAFFAILIGAFLALWFGYPH